MPRYDYRCDNCGTVREVTVSNWKDATDPLAGFMKSTCDCGGILEKMPAAPNFSISGYSARNSYGVKNETK